MPTEPSSEEILFDLRRAADVKGSGVGGWKAALLVAPRPMPKPKPSFKRSNGFVVPCWMAGSRAAAISLEILSAAESWAGVVVAAVDGGVAAAVEGRDGKVPAVPGRSVGGVCSSLPTAARAGVASLPKEAASNPADGGFASRFLDSTHPESARAHLHRVSTFFGWQGPVVREH